MRKTRILAAGAITALAVTPVAATEAMAPKPVKKTVRVGDNFYAPNKVSVPVNSIVTWKWPGTPGDVHDVYSRSRPRGAKRFRSELSASDYSFKRKLTKPGLYRVVCTIHAEMTMTIRVKRPPR